MLVLTASSIFACATLADDLVSDRIVRGVFHLLLTRSRYGFGPAEEAAFLIRTEHGIAFLHWPASSDRNEAMWEGPIPAGTIAIAHTHPGWMPMPSRIDATTSRKTGLAVYVITPSQISRTNGGAAEVVSMGWDR